MSFSEDRDPRVWHQDSPHLRLRATSMSLSVLQPRTEQMFGNQSISSDVARSALRNVFTSCDHFHADTLLQTLVDGLLSIVPWGVKQRQKSYHLPVVPSLQQCERWVYHNWQLRL